MITALYFKLATGRDDTEDDLERVNCPNAGEIGHHNCGWNYKYNCPAFERTTTSEDRTPRDYRPTSL